MAQMCVSVDSGSADIQPDESRMYRYEKFFLSRKSIRYVKISHNPIGIR